MQHFFTYCKGKEEIRPEKKSTLNVTSSLQQFNNQCFFFSLPTAFHFFLLVFYMFLYFIPFGQQFRLVNLQRHLEMSTIVKDITTATKITLGYVILIYMFISGNVTFLSLRNLSYIGELPWLYISFSKILQQFNIKGYSKLPAVSCPHYLFAKLHPHMVGCLLPLQLGSPPGG